MADNTKPRLSFLNVPANADVSAGLLRFEVEAQDDTGGSGIAYVQVVFDRPMVDAQGRALEFFQFRNDSPSTIDDFDDATPNLAVEHLRISTSTPPGTYHVTFVAVADKAGNTEILMPAALKALGINTSMTLFNSKAPPAPSARVIVNEAGYVVGDAVTITGTAQPGEIVEVVGRRIYEAPRGSGDTYGQNVVLGRTTADQAGNWTLVATDLQDGAYTEVAAKQIDGQGNASPLSAPFSFDINTSLPSVPEVAVAMDGAGVSTRQANMLWGEAEPHNTIYLYEQGQLLGTGRSDVFGHWYVKTPPLAAGRHSFTVYAENTGGLQSGPATLDLVVDPRPGIRFTIGHFQNLTDQPLEREAVQAVLDEVSARFSAAIAGNIEISLATSVRQLQEGAAANAGSWFTPVMGSDGRYTTPTLDAAQLNLSPGLAGVLAGPTGVFTHSSISLFVHEMLHVLGFNGTSVMNRYVKYENGAPFFYGPNALAIYGKPVDMNADLGHVLDPNDTIHSSTANGSTWYAPGNPLAPLSPLDLAMLRDFGYQIKDTIVSYDGRTFIPGTQTLNVTGTGGIDTVKYDGAASDYRVKVDGVASTVTRLGNPSDSDTLASIERIMFDDRMLAIDIWGNAGQAYRLYQAAFDRTPDLGGLGFWIAQMDNGIGLGDIAAAFYSSVEFQQMYGSNPSSSVFLTRLYENILDRAPDPAGYAFWLDKLDKQHVAMQELLALFSESSENQAALIGILEHGVTYTPYGA